MMDNYFSVHVGKKTKILRTWGKNSPQITVFPLKIDLPLEKTSQILKMMSREAYSPQIAPVSE